MPEGDDDSAPGSEDEPGRRLLVLTDRERGVLDQLRAGRSVEEIAERQQVAVSTVRTQVRTILRKLGVRSQLAAVAIARWSTEPEHRPRVLSDSRP